MGNLLSFNPKIHRLRTHAKILCRFSHGERIFFRKGGGIFFLRFSERNCPGLVKRGTYCEARGMLSWGRCILARVELEAAVHRFYLSASWTDSPFEIAGLDVWRCGSAL